MVNKMNESYLEKLDLIRERVGVSYKEAKEALEICHSDVVEAIIYLEDKKIENPSPVFTTLEGFKNWLMELINMGNINRIKIKKQDKVLVNVPINAGVAAGFIAVIWTPIMIASVATAVVARLTIEITKADGSVEIVNTVIKNSVQDVSGKLGEFANSLKDKVKNRNSNEEIVINDEPIYKYSVTFDDLDDKK